MGEYKLLVKDFPSFNSQQIFSLKKIPLFGFLASKVSETYAKVPEIKQDLRTSAGLSVSEGRMKSLETVILCESNCQFGTEQAGAAPHGYQGMHDSMS